MKPHSDAVLTIISTLPENSDSETCLPLISSNVKSWADFALISAPIACGALVKMITRPNISLIMIISPAYWQNAKNYLSETDVVLGKIISSHDGMLMSAGAGFRTLLRAIVGQQISVKAADSIWARLEALGPLQPEAVLTINDDDLRSIGLSRQKALYVKNIAEFCAVNSHKDFFYMDSADLLAIKGVGSWTAEMFDIFHKLEPDIFPVKDIGVLKAVEKHYFDGAKADVEEIVKLSQKWAPYRTVATWYFWRSLDPVPVEY